MFTVAKEPNKHPLLTLKHLIRIWESGVEQLLLSSKSQDHTSGSSTL